MRTIAKEDLDNLRIDLLREIAGLRATVEAFLKEQQQKEVPEPQLWIRSGAVRKMLGISAATLFNLRVGRVLNARKIGGTYFYDTKEIRGLLEKKEGRYGRG